MISIILKITDFLILLLLCNVVQATTLLNSSYDVSRELFMSINSSFIKQWRFDHPNDKLIIRQSHAGSSKQALMILQGLEADVVTYNQVPDIQILHDRGKLLSADWRLRLPYNSSPYYSTMAFLVRKGNPKGIYDWHDLARDKVKVIFPNPKTSGNGRYTYLAAWGVISQDNGNDQDKTRIWMRKFLNNVEVFDIGGRGSTISFIEHNQGDVLINFESEINTICDQYKKDKYEIIVPSKNILAEFPVTWIDTNVQKHGTEQLAIAYLKYLYSPTAQKIITSFYYRVNTIHNMKQNDRKFPIIKMFKVEEQFGNWQELMCTHFKHGGELDKLLKKG